MKIVPRIIKDRFNQMFAKRFFTVSGSLAVFLVCTLFFVVWWQLFPEIRSQTFVPLHYNVHFGVDLFGIWWNIFTIPIFGASILIINVIIALVVWKREPVLSYFFTGLAVIAEILLLVAIVFVIILNLSYYG